jgi:hypothetical protein
MPTDTPDLAAFFAIFTPIASRDSAFKDDHEHATFVVHRKKMVTIYN